MRSRWRTMLDGSREEALLAVDLYNQPRQPRRLEAYFVHMHLAWLYLLHARLQRDGEPFVYRLPNGRIERVEGEPKTWDLAQCISKRWTDQNPVRKNLEFTIALRNKIEHRYHNAIALVASGHAQALLINYEDELTSEFGADFSLGEELRFPIFVGAITPIGQARIDNLRDSLPRSARDFIARFESDLDPTIAQDQRYEFRVNLVQKTGPRTESDRAMTFVREADLDDAQRETLRNLGKTGTVIIREQSRPVSGLGMMKPTIAASKVSEQIPFIFHVGHLVRAWKKLDCRPAGGSSHPERTIEKYCVYDEPHGDYLYTTAFVDKLVRETKTAAKFESFLGLAPAQKDTDAG